MSGYLFCDFGLGWLFMTVGWAALIGVIVWAVLRIFPKGGPSEPPPERVSETGGERMPAGTPPR